jgi:hypothetical protein
MKTGKQKLSNVPKKKTNPYTVRPKFKIGDDIYYPSGTDICSGIVKQIEVIYEKILGNKNSYTLRKSISYKLDNGHYNYDSVRQIEAFKTPEATKRFIISQIG